ncbi:MAG: hypothetical protein ACKVS6_10920 [Planctomycetota bacterium]
MMHFFSCAPREKCLRLAAGLLLYFTSFVVSASAASQIQTLTTVNGSVNDITVDSTGNLLYCTEQGEIGRITPAGAVVIILADATTGPFPNALRGVVQTPSGDVAVVDAVGDIYKLPGGIAPAVKVYSDLYMIVDPTDLMVDGAGNYFVASQTPTTGTKAINWISSDGSRWSYYVVKHSPIAIAYDPVTNNILMADSGNGGTLRSVHTADESLPVTPLDTATLYGNSFVNNDGDLAVEANGNVLIVSNGKLYRFDRTLGSSTVLATGLGNVRGISITVSSGNIASASGYSAYIAAGSNPTTIFEYPNISGPTNVNAPALGVVPSRGLSVSVWTGMNVFEMMTDDNFDLLVGGDLWGTNAAVKRINTSTLAVTTVANQAQGISSRVEGLAVGPDRSIYVLTEAGAIHRIVESPFQVSTLFTDPFNQIAIGVDLVYDFNGDFYVASRQGFLAGNITKISGGIATHVAAFAEMRGITADPVTAKPFYTEWVNSGFVGRIGNFDPNTNIATPIPGFSGMNYSNGGVWADGDVAMDVEGNIYTCSEDDFSVHRFNRNNGKLVRIASGYLNHPAGLAIAKSTLASGSTTGWSLFVAEYNYFWEIPSVAAPMPQIADATAPPIGRTVGYFPPSSNLPREMVASPSGTGFYISMSNGTVEYMSLAGARSVIAGAGQGLSGDLTGITTTPTGKIVVGSRTGNVWEIDTTNANATTLIFGNPNGDVFDLRSVLVDGQGRLLIFDRPNSFVAPNCGRLFRLENGFLRLISVTNRGYRGAIDPLTADIFIAQQGNASDGGGEILRVDGMVNPAAAGHYRGNDFYLLKTGPLDGGIAFSSAGDMYIAISAEGRIYHINRSTGVKTVVTGNYNKPVDAILAPGSVGTAGPQGTSLFILDRNAIFEVGVDGLPAGPPPATNPNLALGADMKAHGIVTLGGSNRIEIQSPGDANRLYLAVASVSGKVPGFPFSLYLNGADPRVMPNTPDDIWAYVNHPSYLPDFLGYLDANGASPVTMQLLMPNDPSLMGGIFLDFAWISFEPSALSGIATVGGTAHLYLGN